MIPEVTDHLEIALRAYVEPQTAAKGRRNGAAARPVAPPSEWVLIFDTETTIDEAQSLRIGTYQVRKAGLLYDAGIFYAQGGVTPKELALLQRYASAHSLGLLTKNEFIEQVFYGIGYDLRATIVGLNLPFDISRIALRHNPARGEMRGGFSFTLSNDKRRPQLRVKHLNQRTALISFAVPRKQNRARSERKRGDAPVRTRGHFVDVKTLAAALLSRSFSLGSLSKFLKVEHQKDESDEHGNELTETYLDYAVRDAQTTWECYEDLLRRYQQLGLTETPVTAIFSEASLGKAYLRAMGIKSSNDAPADLIGKIMGTYFGGRSEVRIRRKVRQVVLCDFLSMYPTVCTLQGLWRFVIGKGVVTRDATAEVAAFLETVTCDDLLKPEIWPKLCAIVRIAPSADILPVRASYAKGDPSTIGLNSISVDRGLWFTLADCVAAKLLGGRPPQVLDALRFEPGPAQNGLRPVAIGGNPDNVVNPSQHDLYKRLIELRQGTKNRRDKAEENERAALDVEQNAIKIAANATSYGIFVELNVKELGKKESTRVHPSNGELYTLETDRLEVPGPFFHPLVASLITGAARLMLAITERLVQDAGLEWCFCDTDSMAIARPPDMQDAEFHFQVESIVRRFAALNPYEFGGSILKIEPVNYAVGGENRPEPLFCWAVSAKRYSLFNIDTDGRPIIRKASAHGLGHLKPPYPENAPAPNIQPPALKLEKIGVERWQYDHWYHVILAALDGHPDTVNLGYHPAIEQPAVSRYGATSPRLLKWFKRFNRNRPYEDQVKPFGFLLSYQARRDLFELVGDEPSLECAARRRRGGWRPRPLRPVSPYSTDLRQAAQSAFDRETGGPVSTDQLLTYREALAQYHLHPEMKFLNGDYLDTGTTLRRHVKVTTVRNIGKEADHLEEHLFLGLEKELEIDHGLSPDDAAVKNERLRGRVARIGQRALARELGISRGKLGKLLLRY